MEEQHYTCAQTGIAFRASCPSTGETRNPWSPSLDRIDSSLGYTPENVQVVCSMYNLAKGMFTDDEVAVMAFHLVEIISNANEELEVDTEESLVDQAIDRRWYSHRL